MFSRHSCEKNYQKGFSLQVVLLNNIVEQDVCQYGAALVPITRELVIILPTVPDRWNRDLGALLHCSGRHPLKVLEHNNWGMNGYTLGWTSLCTVRLVAKSLACENIKNTVIFFFKILIKMASSSLTKNRGLHVLKFLYFLCIYYYCHAVCDMWYNHMGP